MMDFCPDNLRSWRAVGRAYRFNLKKNMSAVCTPTVLPPSVAFSAFVYSMLK